MTYKDKNNVPHTIYTIYNTGWRRLIGSPKLQIIFHKRAIKYRLLLRKMTCKDKGSCETSPPCTIYNTRKVPLLNQCSSSPGLLHHVPLKRDQREVTLHMQQVEDCIYACCLSRGMWYGVATISRLLKMLGLFCTRTLQKRLYSAKETYNFKEPTNRSHPIYCIYACTYE